MRLGVSIPMLDAAGRALDLAGVMQRARWAEDAGFDGIWMGDTFGPGVTRPDPLMWLLAAAAATTRVELGTAAVQVPLRNPVELAQRVLTLNALTGRRFRLGVAAGSQRSHAALGLDYDARFRRLREHVDVVRRLCNGEEAGDAFLNPWPEARGCPPVLLGTWASDVWLRRAARDYDGWMASASTSFATLARGIQRFRAAGGGRALVAGIRIDLDGGHAPLADDAPFDLVCAPEQAAQRLRRLAALGFNDALLIKTSPRRAANLYETDFTPADLTAYRALVPRDQSSS
jgi:alkanesulfonate monooxygenase SsuD/methylene tetrahydromethanopterin reductase-like flavin-dependent oxidoreductase (luciferase family)